MKNLQVGELKSKFSKILEEIKNGEEYIISFGKKMEKIAVIIPYSKYKGKSKRKLGILENKAFYKIAGDFSTSYKLPKTMHRDPFDRLIIWQCIQNNITLISRDKELSEYKNSGLQVIW